MEGSYRESVDGRWGVLSTRSLLRQGRSSCYEEPFSGPSALVFGIAAVRAALVFGTHGWDGVPRDTR
jgi:hypothetical protein